MRISIVSATMSWVIIQGVKPNCKSWATRPAKPAGMSIGQVLRGTNSNTDTNNALAGQSTDTPWLERAILWPNQAATYDTTTTRSARTAVRSREACFALNENAFSLSMSRICTLSAITIERSLSTHRHCLTCLSKDVRPGPDKKAYT